MIIFTFLLLILVIILCVISSVTDLKTGKIYNRTLLIFARVGLILDAVYYGYFVRDTFIEFAANFGLVAAVSITLYFVDCFAGGDCKLAIVLSLIYPSIAYFSYGKSNITLCFALAIGVFYSYLYLLGTSIIRLIKRDTHIDRKYITDGVKAFVRAFVSASIYIGILNLVCNLFSITNSLVGQLSVKIVCIALALAVGRYRSLQKWYFLLCSLIVLVALSLHMHVFPVSRNIENYLFVFMLMVCQMTIKTGIYSNIEIADLKPGMILSTFSTVMMQNSRVRGLPEISKQGLSDRLSDAQVESIKRWANGNKISKLIIVKKIPFAFFMSLGFFSYFMIWCVLNALEN